MKLVIKQDILAKALSAVGKIATPKAGLPILSNVLLRAEDTKLTVAATNLEVAMTASLNAKVDEQGAITVPARLLTDFVSNLPHANVEINSEETKLKVVCGGFSSVINAMLADDYPAMPEPAEANELVIDGGTLKAAIQGVTVCAGNDITRPVLTGVDFYSENGELYMAATDGYRLAERRIMATNKVLTSIVPSSTLMDVARLLPDGDATIKYNDEQMSFICGDLTVTSRLIDGKYIQYRQLLPSETNFVAKVNRADLMKATRMASLFAHAVANTIVLDGNPEAHTLTVRTATSQLGNNSSEIEADFSKVEGDTCSVNVNAKFLADALNNLEGDEATLMFNGGLAPIMLKGANPDYRHLIMPVR